MTRLGQGFGDRLVAVRRNTRESVPTDARQITNREHLAYQYLEAKQVSFGLLNGGRKFCLFSMFTAEFCA
jgi:hypothetical protein